MSWLEENVHKVLQAVDAGTPLWRRREQVRAVGVEAVWRAGLSRGPRPPAAPPSSPGPRRKVLYQRAPRNIHRHVVLSEIKEAVAALPPVRSRLTAGSVLQQLCPPVMVHAVFPERQSHACSFRDLMGCRVVGPRLRAHGL